jgi:hypothetical protein
MKILLIISLQTILFLAPLKSAHSATAPLPPMKVGDLIFQKSQSSQSKAIAEATGSEWSHVGIIVKNSKNQWYVAEAVQPLQATELSRWIIRGKNKEYIIKRHPDFKESMISDLYAELRPLQGTNYDIYFEWSDDRIYCSELVYKIFKKLIGQGVGSIQKFKDMRLDGPYVQELIRRRYTDIGKPLNLDEEILTPISQMRDPKLLTVRHYRPSAK